MNTKMFEVRDSGTCIPVLALKMEASGLIEDRFMWRCGYPRDGSAVIVMELNNQKANVDPYAWGGRTMPVAHNYIYDNFNQLNHGQVVDVRVILGEEEQPAEAEVVSLS